MNQWHDIMLTLAKNHAGVAFSFIPSRDFNEFRITAKFLDGSIGVIHKRDGQWTYSSP